MQFPIEKQRIKMMINKLYAQVYAGNISNDWAEKFICDVKARFDLGKELHPNTISKLEELFDQY